MAETPTTPAREVEPPTVTEATNRWRENFFGRLAIAARHLESWDIRAPLVLFWGINTAQAIHSKEPDLAAVNATIGFCSVVVPLGIGLVSERIARHRAR